MFVVQGAAAAECPGPGPDLHSGAAQQESPWRRILGLLVQHVKMKECFWIMRMLIILSIINHEYFNIHSLFLKI